MDKGETRNMNESYLMVLSQIANSLERVAEALESIEDNMRVRHEPEEVDE